MPVQVLSGHGGIVTSIGLSPCGRLLATASGTAGAMLAGAMLAGAMLAGAMLAGSISGAFRNKHRSIHWGLLQNTSAQDAVE